MCPWSATMWRSNSFLPCFSIPKECGCVAERIAVLRCSAPAVLKPASTFRDVRIEGAAPVARFALRGGSEAAKAAGSVLHMDMALAACRSVQREEVAALWLGPDEWLLLAPHEQEKNLADMLRAA